MFCLLLSIDAHYLVIIVVIAIVFISNISVIVSSVIFIAMVITINNICMYIRFQCVSSLLGL